MSCVRDSTSWKTSEEVLRVSKIEARRPFAFPLASKIRVKLCETVPSSRDLATFCPTFKAFNFYRPVDEVTDIIDIEPLERYEPSRNRANQARRCSSSGSTVPDKYFIDIAEFGRPRQLYRSFVVERCRCQLTCGYCNNSEGTRYCNNSNEQPLFGFLYSPMNFTSEEKT